MSDINVFACSKKDAHLSAASQNRSIIMTPVRAGKQPGNKTTVACIRCKEAKTKCGGSPGKDCPGCRKAQVPCIYRKTGPTQMMLKEDVEAIAAKNEALEAQNDSLGAQIEALRACLQELQASQTSPGAVSVAIVPESEETRGEYVSMFKEAQTIFVSPSGNPTFMGPGATAPLMHTLVNKTQNLSGEEFNPQDEDDGMTWRIPPTPTPIQLPRPAVARHLYQSQYVYIGTIFAFAQRKHFETRLNHFSRFLPDPESQESCLAYCQLLLVYAYGELYSVNQWTKDGPPGLHFFKHALKYLPSAHEPGSVLFVEVLAMVGYYLQVLNRRDAAFLYIGMALRMAISLGLHQELGEKSTVGSVDREHRRRVWWSVYSMDRILTVKSGNPITIHDGDIDVNWPTPLQELDDDSPVALVLSCYSKLSKILGRIGEDIYRRKHSSGNTLLMAVQSIMNDLSAWWRDLPAALRINLATIHLDLSREAVSTYLHFHQCINMTVRPLLYSVTQNQLKAKTRSENRNWRDGLPAIVVTNIESTILAAQTTAQLTSAALSKNLLATYGFMDGEHAFSSALTLVMANIALDNDTTNATAMETTLRVLASMAEKGNRYVEYRLALLQNLRSTIPTTHLDHNHHHLPLPVQPLPPPPPPPTENQVDGAPLEQTVTGGSSIYATPPGLVEDPMLTLFPGFPQPMNDPVQDIPFDMNMEDDAHLGFLDDQVWIQDMQILQEQIP